MDEAHRAALDKDPRRLAALLSIALTAALSFIVGLTWHDWHPAQVRTFDPVDTAGVGGIITFILLVVLGVKAATSEYAAGMVRLTLTATPQRWRVLGAKAVVVTASPSMPPSLDPGSAPGAWRRGRRARRSARRGPRCRPRRQGRAGAPAKRTRTTRSSSATTRRSTRGRSVTH